MSFYSVDEIRLLHLELSSDCNAECPLCVRNLFGYPLNQGHKVHLMTLAEVEQMFAQIDRVRASGLYHSHEQLRPLIKDNNILAHGLARAIEWFDLVEESWTKESYNSGQLLRCNTVCGQR